MKPLLLAIALTNGSAVVRFQTPTAGSYSLECSSDFLRWRVVASGHVNQPSHVTTKCPVGPSGFYRVTFKP